jgi:hypothetical protein
MVFAVSSTCGIRLHVVDVFLQQVDEIFPAAQSLAAFAAPQSLLNRLVAVLYALGSMHECVLTIIMAEVRECIFGSFIFIAPLYCIANVPLICPFDLTHGRHHRLPNSRGSCHRVPTPIFCSRD